MYQHEGFEQYYAVTWYSISSGLSLSWMCDSNAIYAHCKCNGAYQFCDAPMLFTRMFQNTCLRWLGWQSMKHLNPSSLNIFSFNYKFLAKCFRKRVFQSEHCLIVWQFTIVLSAMCFFSFSSLRSHMKYSRNEILIHVNDMKSNIVFVWTLLDFHEIFQTQIINDAWFRRGYSHGRDAVWHEEAELAWYIKPSHKSNDILTFGCFR